MSNLVPLSRVAARFNHALMMVSTLIPHTADNDLPEHVRIACLEDWFTNYRLLIEFLAVGAPKNCATAQDFVPGWRAETSIQLRGLREDYGFASEHVVHIGWPKPAAPQQNLWPPILEIKASLLLDVVDQFVHEMHFRDHHFAELVGLAARQARERLQPANVPPVD